VVAVVAGTFDLDGLVVEEETLGGVPAEGADAEGRVVFIDGLAIARESDVKLIKIRFFDRPEPRVGDFDLLDDFDFRPRVDFGFEILNRGFQI
jgi:hypothetical protein